MLGIYCWAYHSSKTQKNPLVLAVTLEGQILGVLTQGGIPSATGSSTSALQIFTGFFAPIPDVSFLDITSNVVADRFQFDACRLSTPAVLSADLRLEHEVGAGGFKSCHPAKFHSDILMTGKEIVLKEMYAKKGNR
jgi:hypothetical protein